MSAQHLHITGCGWFPDHDIWCMLLHAEHWVTSYLPMGFHHCQYETSYFGCRLFASLWACCRRPTSNPVGFHYTSSCEWPFLWSFFRHYTYSSGPNPFLSLLSDFPGVTQACTANLPIKHSVTHHITTTGLPVSSRNRRLAPERLRVARQEFDHMLELGIICPSSSS